jgi:hypothetical protein
MTFDTKPSHFRRSYTAGTDHTRSSSPQTEFRRLSLPSLFTDADNPFGSGNSLSTMHLPEKPARKGSIRASAGGGVSKGLLEELRGDLQGGGVKKNKGEKKNAANASDTSEQKRGVTSSSLSAPTIVMKRRSSLEAPPSMPHRRGSLGQQEQTPPCAENHTCSASQQNQPFLFLSTMPTDPMLGRQVYCSSRMFAPPEKPSRKVPVGASESSDIISEYSDQAPTRPVFDPMEKSRPWEADLLLQACPRPPDLPVRQESLNGASSQAKIQLSSVRVRVEPKKRRGADPLLEDDRTASMLRSSFRIDSNKKDPKLASPLFPGREVSFNATVQCRTTTHHKDYNAFERRSSWVTAEEMETARSEILGTVEEMEGLSPRRAAIHSTRGLEYLTDEGAALRKGNRAAAIAAVLRLQTQQRESGSNNDASTNMLAEVYRKSSQNCQITARLLARIDAEQVLDGFLDDSSSVLLPAGAIEDLLAEARKEMAPLKLLEHGRLA